MVIMENYAYTAVRALAATYLFYRLFIILFRERLFGIWDRIPVREKKKKLKKEPSERPSKKRKVVGPTDTTLLPDPLAVEKKPVMEEPLEPSDYIGEDPGLEPEVPVIKLSISVRVPDEELEDDDEERPLPDPEFSTGLTYEQIVEAVDYVSAPTDNDEVMMRSAKTLSSIRNSEVFDFIEKEVSNTEALEELFAECLDGNGEPLPRRRSKMNEEDLASFDINRFV